MKETYVLAVFPNGMVRPCLIRKEESPFLVMGDKIITDKGSAVCIGKEEGRYEERDSVEEICNLMGLGRDSLPVAHGTITERMWDDEK